jgi:hypothetical protein
LNKLEIIRTTDLNKKLFERITKYKTREFTFKYDIKFTNFIRYDEYLYPFVVFKHNKIKNWDDKLTFCGMVFNRVDASLSYNLDNSNVVLCDDIEKYRDRIGYRNNDRPFVANMKDIFEYVFNNEKYNRQCCDNCVLSEFIKMPYKCIDCPMEKLGHGEKIMTFIVIDYYDLNDELKSKYDDLFDNKKCRADFIKCSNITFCKKKSLHKINEGSSLIVDNAVEEEEDFIEKFPNPIVQEINTIKSELDKHKNKLDGIKREINVFSSYLKEQKKKNKVIKNKCVSEDDTSLEEDKHKFIDKDYIISSEEDDPLPDDGDISLSDDD